MKNKWYKLYFKVIAVMVYVLVTNNAEAQMMNTTVSKRDILIGEKISYTLSIERLTNDSIYFAIPDSIPHFDLIENYRSDSITADGKKFWQTNIVFTSFDSGSFDFPQLELGMGKTKDKAQRLFTNAFKVNVGYMPTDKEGKPRDIKAVIEVDFFDWYWVKIGIGILATLIILFFLIKSLFKKKVPEFNNLNKSAYRDALDAIEKLRAANKEQTIVIKELHTSLANILKTYYGVVDGTNILNKTSTEVLDKLKEYQLNAETTLQTQQALDTSDATKFAKYNPLFVENETSINFIKNTIEELEILRNKKI